MDAGLLVVAAARDAPAFDACNETGAVGFCAARAPPPDDAIVGGGVDGSAADGAEASSKLDGAGAAVTGAGKVRGAVEPVGVAASAGGLSLGPRSITMAAPVATNPAITMGTSTRCRARAARRSGVHELPTRVSGGAFAGLRETVWACATTTGASSGAAMVTRASVVALVSDARTRSAAEVVPAGANGASAAARSATC